MKRVLLTIPTVTSYNFFLREFMEALPRFGWEGHLAASLTPIRGFDCYEEPAAGASHHIDFPRGADPVGHLAAARSLRSLVARLRPDVVHCHFSVTAFTAALARRRSWPPTIATIQGLMFAETNGWRKAVFAAAEVFAQSRMDGTWVLTRSDVEALAALGIRDRIFLQKSSGFGCRLDRFDPLRFDPEQRGELRRRLGFSETDFIFAFIGRQVHFKGFAMVVKAFLALAPSQPRARLLLVGQRDPLHPTGLTPAEESALRQAKGVVAVEWQEDVSPYLAIAQVNVFPSRREGIPVSLMESLAMGVPAITLNTRGCRDVVRDGIDGLVLTDMSVSALRAAMLRLMTDEKLHRCLATQAWEGRLRFDRSAWIEEQVGIYEQAVTGIPGARR